jgi:hypothetical protein
MTSQERLIRARLGILAVAIELKNVAKACKLAGISRSQFYTMKKAYETNGKGGLAPRARRKPQMPNQTPAAIEDHILLKTLSNPMISYVRLAEQIKAEGIAVTPTMIRYVWQRHGLGTRIARLQWVKRRNGRFGGTKANGIVASSIDLDRVTRVSGAPPVPPPPTFSVAEGRKAISD